MVICTGTQLGFVACAGLTIAPIASIVTVLITASIVSGTLINVYRVYSIITDNA